MIAIPPENVERASFASFISTVKTTRSALWSKGRSIILIVEGQEREFAFDESLTETKALALVRARGLAVIREEAPGVAVLLTSIGCMLVLASFFFLN